MMSREEMGTPISCSRSRALFNSGRFMKWTPKVSKCKLILWISQKYQWNDYQCLHYVSPPQLLTFLFSHHQLRCFNIFFILHFNSPHTWGNLFVIIYLYEYNGVVKILTLSVLCHDFFLVIPEFCYKKLVKSVYSYDLNMYHTGCYFLLAPSYILQVLSCSLKSWTFLGNNFHFQF